MLDLEKKSQEVSLLLKLLAHPKRFLILCKLRGGPQTVWELEKYCTIWQSQLSQFLSKMREEGILKAEKQWQFVSYSIADPRIIEITNALGKIFCNPENTWSNL